jgi:hypothetical protein
MSLNVGIDFTELGDPENIGYAVGILCVSFMRREMQVLPVWQLPSCSSGVCHVGEGRR